MYPQLRASMDSQRSQLWDGGAGVRNMPEEPEPGERQQQPDDYEPPRLTVLGSLDELTRGVVPVTTDGVLPGSIL
jgi:hypothetical protein